MTRLITAYTKLAPNYPGYVNFTKQDDGSVVLTVRGDPTIRENGCFVCGFAKDKGQPGRCTPGDENCNNYCNLAPEKGPMVDHPLDTTQVFCGETVAITLSVAEWDALKAGLK